MKVIVIYDSKSKAIFAHAIPQKGIDEAGYCVECFADDILWLGYARVIVRSDNEPAIAKLVREVLAATPWQSRQATEPEVVFRGKEAVPETTTVLEIREVRRVYIKQEDLEAFGYTKGCPRCDNILRYGYGKTTKGHNDTCRKRIMERLAETPQGQLRIARMTERVDQYVSDNCTQ